MKNTVMIDTELYTCPACGQPILGRHQVELVVVGELKEGKVPFEGELIGTQLVPHDCTKKATR